MLFCGEFGKKLISLGKTLGKVNSGFSECSEGSGDCDQDSDCMGSLASIWYFSKYCFAEIGNCAFKCILAHLSNYYLLFIIS